MAESSSSAPDSSLPDGIVSAEVAARTEKRWIVLMVAMLIVMLAVIVVTGVAGAMHPPSNVEVIDLASPRRASTRCLAMNSAASAIRRCGRA